MANVRFLVEVRLIAVRNRRGKFVHNREGHAVSAQFTGDLRCSTGDVLYLVTLIGEEVARDSFMPIVANVMRLGNRCSLASM